jgi:hypothetical protein
MPSLTGPFTVVLLFAAFLFFGWTFWDLIGDMRDSQPRIQGRPRSAWRWPWASESTRTAHRFDEFRSHRATEPPRATARESESSGRESLGFSRTLETWVERPTGEIRGRVVGGPFRGRGLEALSRVDCLRLHDYCLQADAEAARLLAAYLDRRFGGAWRPKPGAGQGGRRPTSDGAMTRQDAYAALGLASGAADRDIVKAHRALIKKYHPDHGGSTADAARVNQAKELLLDKRA